MGKSRKKLQAKRARDGAMDIDTSNGGPQVPALDQEIAEMDTAETVVKPKALSQNRLSKKSITKRRAVNVRKKKAIEKAQAMAEKKHQKIQQDSTKLRALREEQMNTRPVSEWGLDPMCFSHVHLLAFDFLRLQQVQQLPGSYTRRGRPVRKLEMLGVVVSLELKPKYVRFVLDDGTGCVPCILWTNHSYLGKGRRFASKFHLSAEIAAAQSASVKLGHLLRVQGRVSSYNQQLQVTVSSVLVEVDANAEVLHWMECMKLALNCYNLAPRPPVRAPNATASASS